MLVENRSVARRQPVLISQPQRVAERVDLPLALVEFGAHLGLVAHPLVVGIRIVGIEECVGVGIEFDALELAADNARQHAAQVLVLIGQLEIGPHLRTGVAEPHGMDIARVNDRIVLAVGVLAGADRRVERIGEAVLQHPRQLGVGQHALDAGDLLFHGFRTEQTFGFGGTVRRGICGRRLRFGLLAGLGHTRIVGRHRSCGFARSGLRGFGGSGKAHRAGRDALCGAHHGGRKADVKDFLHFHFVAMCKLSMVILSGPVSRRSCVRTSRPWRPASAATSRTACPPP